jgi:hypothetical protein
MNYFSAMNEESPIAPASRFSNSGDFFQHFKTNGRNGDERNAECILELSYHNYIVSQMALHYLW